jgi:hypothetical protein
MQGRSMTCTLLYPPGGSSYAAANSTHMTLATDLDFGNDRSVIALNHCHRCSPRAMLGARPGANTASSPTWTPGRLRSHSPRWSRLCELSNLSETPR